MSCNKHLCCATKNVEILENVIASKQGEGEGRGEKGEKKERRKGEPVGIH